MSLLNEGKALCSSSLGKGETSTRTLCSWNCKPAQEEHSALARELG